MIFTNLYDVRRSQMSFLFGFSGRVGRLQWWGVQLATTILFFAISLSMIPFIKDLENTGSNVSYAPFIAFLAAVVLAIWINLAVTVKRYHDRDKSGSWLFIAFVPFGGLWQLVECGFFSGTPGQNSYGSRDGASGISGGSLDSEIEAMRSGNRADGMISNYLAKAEAGNSPFDNSATIPSSPARPGPKTGRVQRGKPSFGQRSR